MKRNLLITSALALACLAHTTVSMPGTAQKRLDAMPRGNGLVTGAPIGGEAWLSAKSITIDKPILLGSGQSLIGAGIGATEIVYTGPAGTSAIELRSFAGHGYIHLPTIRNLTTRCTVPGATAAGKHASAGTIEGLRIADAVLLGGGVNLPGEHYFARLERVHFRHSTTQPVRLDGQAHLLDGVNVLANLPVPGVTAAVEVRGSVEIRGWSRVEGAWGVPLLDVRDWNGHQGYLNMAAGVWLEPHLAGESVRLTNARANICEPVAAWPHCPWRLIHSTVNSGVKFDPAAVKMDAASKLYIGGSEQAVPAQQ